MASAESDHFLAAPDDVHAESAAQGISAPSELAVASIDEPSQANEHSRPPAELAIASTNENSKYSPQEEDGASEIASAFCNGSPYATESNPQEDAVTEPALATMDQSSDVNKHTPQEEDAAADLVFDCTDRSSDVVKNAHADVVAKGIASVLGPVMNNFEGGVEGALKSQSILSSSIDRLTRELDKLLEDVPLAFSTLHATRLSKIRKRILTLNTSLRIIQGRMGVIQRFRTAYASKAMAKDKQEKALLFSRENASHSLSLMEVPPIIATSSSSAEDHENDDGQILKGRGSEILDQFGNIQSGGLLDNNAEEDLASSKELSNEISNQEPLDLQNIRSDE